jgi:hypothetical protein
MFETVILGAGPAGTGPLVWAARHGLLAEWLSAGLALVERTRSITGTVGQYGLNADTLADTFLECLDGPCCEPALAALRSHPVTRKLATWRGRLPPLPLVGQFFETVGGVLSEAVARHPRSLFLPVCTGQAIRLEADGTVTALIEHDGQQRTLRAASAVMALGGEQDQSWPDITLLPGLALDRWDCKLVPSDVLLTQGGTLEVQAMLARSRREPLAVIIGGSHSAFSSAWRLLNHLPDVAFGPGGVRMLYRASPKIFYPSREAATAEGYVFREEDVCPATGRVFRLSGLRGDGRDVCRRMEGLGGMERERRVVATPIRDMNHDELARLLDAADVIIPALGYRLTTIPVFDAAGRSIPLARVGPSVDANARLLTDTGEALENVFGIGLGSDFKPWGAMAGEASFHGQQNSLWLYQNGLGQSIYHGVRRYAAQRASVAAEQRGPNPVAA